MFLKMPRAVSGHIAILLNRYELEFMFRNIPNMRNLTSLNQVVYSLFLTERMHSSHCNPLYIYNGMIFGIKL